MSNKFKLLFLLFCCTSVFFSAEAQSVVPQWLDPIARKMSFPPEVYFSGFTQGELQANENISALLERLKADAKMGAAGNIRTLIESKTDKMESQITRNHDFDFHSAYQEHTQHSVSAEIAGFSVEAYYDEHKKWGYAFAYVKKSDLAIYYKAQIDLHLQQIENTMATIPDAANADSKLQARQMAESALQSLSKAEFAQGLLTAVAPEDEENLQMERFSRVKKELLQILANLEQNIYIHLLCTESNHGQPVRILEPELKRILTTHQCSFTDEPSQADYKITITATTREHDGSLLFGENPFKYSIADVEIEVYNNDKHKVIYGETISQKNNKDGATYESAGRNALKLSAAKIWEGIKSLIVGE